MMSFWRDAPPTMNLYMMYLIYCYGAMSYQFVLYYGIDFQRCICHNVDVPVSKYVYVIDF